MPQSHATYPEVSIFSGDGTRGGAGWHAEKSKPAGNADGFVDVRTAYSIKIEIALVRTSWQPSAWLSALLPARRGFP